MGTKIAVFESRWHSNFNGIAKNTTIRPLFEFLSELHFGNHHEFDYEMVGTKQALDEGLKRLALSKKISVAYLGMHGNSKGLHLHSGDIVTRTHLKNTLCNITQIQGAKYSGLYLGSCLFGTKSLARHLLLNQNVSLNWVAGYATSVDFIKSTALDLLFFNSWLDIKRQNPKLSEIRRIRILANQLKFEVPGLISNANAGQIAKGLGFSIFVRKQGRTRDVIDLLA